MSRGEVFPYLKGERIILLGMYVLTEHGGLEWQVKFELISLIRRTIEASDQEL